MHAIQLTAIEKLSPVITVFARFNKRIYLLVPQFIRPVERLVASVARKRSFSGVQHFMPRHVLRTCKFLATNVTWKLQSILIIIYHQIGWYVTSNEMAY